MDVYIWNSNFETDMVQQIQQFKIWSSIFQVNMKLRIEYWQITNQTLQSFLPAVQMF